MNRLLSLSVALLLLGCTNRRPTQVAVLREPFLVEMCIAGMVADELTEHGDSPHRETGSLTPEIAYDGVVGVFPALDEDPPVVRLRFDQYAGDRLHSEVIPFGDVPSLRESIREAIQRAEKRGAFEKMGQRVKPFDDVPEPSFDCETILRRAAQTRVNPPYVDDGM